MAIICDSHKGGDTVMAAALQSTPSRTVIWLAANEKPKARTVHYLQSIIGTLMKATPDTRVRVAEEISDCVVKFCQSRMNYYRKELSRELPRCLSKLSKVEPASDSELEIVIQWLTDLQTHASILRCGDSSIKGLVNGCMQCRIYFPMLARFSRRETDQHQPITRTKHFIGRLAMYPRTVNTLLDVALEIPQLLENCELRLCDSSRHLPSPLNSELSTLDGIVRRMFPEFTANEVRSDLDRLNVFGNLHKRLSRACSFKTRVHAELLVLEKFRSNRWEFVAGDRYIGCSKPSCFCCYHYINSLPERYSVSGCHNKIYTHWRAPDLTGVQDLEAVKVREDALNAAVAKLRAEGWDDPAGLSLED
uniref:Uncharacterized protein n=1 Tax=Talaromyces marneffei PM1 TaxID=1077442 RepID=A0A093VHP4_TALMA